MGKDNFGGTDTNGIQAQVFASFPPAQPVAEQESISEMTYPRALPTFIQPYAGTATTFTSGCGDPGPTGSARPRLLLRSAPGFLPTRGSRNSR